MIDLDNTGVTAFNDPGDTGMNAHINNAASEPKDPSPDVNRPREDNATSGYYALPEVDVIDGEADVVGEFFLSGRGVYIPTLNSHGKRSGLDEEVKEPPKKRIHVDENSVELSTEASFRTEEAQELIRNDQEEENEESETARKLFEIGFFSDLNYD